MTRATFDDETLMAFADGELDPAASEALLEAMAEDEALAERVAFMADTRRLAKAALAPALAEPVPAALEAKVRALLAATDKAGAGAARAAPPAANDNAWRRWRDMAAAACVALAVGAGLGWQAGGSVAGPDAGPTPFASLARADLAPALASLPSGTEQALADGARLRVIATFRPASDEVCREFELDGPDGGAVVSVACRNATGGGQDGGGWDVRFAVASAQTGEGFAPASSLETLGAYLEQIGAGMPMDAAAEREALGLAP
jgi:anti-sigma factor RsiW